MISIAEFDNSKHQPAECPRCGRVFACKANAPHKCECVKVSLTQNEVIFIKEEMFDETDCLCMTCLEELKLIFSLKEKRVLEAAN